MKELSLTKEKDIFFFPKTRVKKDPEQE